VVQAQINRCADRHGLVIDRQLQPEAIDQGDQAYGRAVMIDIHLALDRRLPEEGLGAPGVVDIVGAAALYQNEDKYQPVNVNCYGEGDQFAWHFDSWNAFTLTLMLQAAESGGEFEIVPDIRSDEDPRFAEVGSVLRGGSSRVIRVPREPRGMVIFRGCNSMHRVTPVVGSRQRIMSIFVYENEPGIQGDPKVNETVYGAPPALA
jgi:hypothetical protein